MLFRNNALCRVSKITSRMQTDPERIRLEDNRIGYVLSGVMTVYYPDCTYSVNPNQVFFAPAGPQFVQYSEQYSAVYFRFNDQAIMNCLNVLYPRYDILDYPSSQETPDLPIFPCWPELKRFFSDLKEDIEPAILKLRLSEVLLLLISHNEYQCQASMVKCIGRLKDPFERIIRDSIFENLSVTQMMERTNRSVTTFKKDFKRVFNDTPHHWLLKQRLLYARMLVLSTSLPVGQVAIESGFENFSHFIRLFKNLYQITPSAMRKSRESK